MNAIVRHEGSNQIQTAADVRAHVNRIQEVMKAVMKKDVHYGVIPGTQKPTLYKPGAEVLATTFRLAPSYMTEDLSSDSVSRYRVTCRLKHQATDTVMGDGMGACSSEEEKYKWRRPVCDEEFELTAENMRRIKFQKGQGGKVFKNPQIRTDKADIDNTILKMACKRAFIAATLNVLAASDIFTQDIEDLPEELRNADDDIQAEPRQPVSQPQRKSEAQKPEQTTESGALKENQIKLIKAKIEASGSVSEADLFKNFDAQDYSGIQASKVNDVLEWIKKNG